MYCTVRYCTVLCCTLLYSTVLYTTMPYFIVLSYNSMYSTPLYCNVVYCTVQYSTLRYSIVLYVPCCAILSITLLKVVCRCDVTTNVCSVLTSLWWPSRPTDYIVSHVYMLHCVTFIFVKLCDMSYSSIWIIATCLHVILCDEYPCHIMWYIFMFFIIWHKCMLHFVKFIYVIFYDISMLHCVTYIYAILCDIPLCYMGWNISIILCAMSFVFLLLGCSQKMEIKTLAETSQFYYSYVNDNMYRISILRVKFPLLNFYCHFFKYINLLK